MNSAPSPKQAETLQHIKQFITDNGYSPSVVELAGLAGINQNAVQDRINGLCRKGLIHRSPGLVRTIRPVDQIDA